MDRVLKRKYHEEEVAAEGRQGDCRPKDHHGKCCPRLPGALFRIYIPAGAVVDLLNQYEISSPSGICLVVRSLRKCGAEAGEEEADQFMQLLGAFLEKLTITVEEEHESNKAMTPSKILT